MTTKTISQDIYLQALGLWTMARQRQEECIKFENELARFLDIESGSCLSDAIYSYEPGTVETFNAALEKTGITIEEP